MALLVGFSVFAIYKKLSPVYWALALSVSLTAFYIALCLPLKKMLGGNMGDETFIFSFFTQVLSGRPGQDYFYSHLPTFYSPLYFWLIGALASPWVENGLAAAKAGAAAVLFVWFIGFQLWFKFYFAKIAASEEQTSPLANPWIPLLTATAFLLLLDFGGIVFKPYEVITALFGVAWCALVGQSFDQKWHYKKYLFFGLSGGLLFLTYYFWWFIIAPALAIAALWSREKIKNLSRLSLVGLLIATISLPYTWPLLRSYAEYGLENWQAAYFYAGHLFSYLPFSAFSLTAVIAALGLLGLLFGRKHPAMRAALIGLVACYAYQLANVGLFLIKRQSFQAQKPFPDLAAAFLALGAGFITVYLYQRYLADKSQNLKRGLILTLVLLFISLLPFGAWIDQPSNLKQLKIDSQTPPIKVLADEIKTKAPDYADRTGY